MINTPEKLLIINRCPEDSEWTAHIKLLNEYTDPDYCLGAIIRYARSGNFYPTNMHVDLIQQILTASNRELLERVEQEVIGKNEAISNKLHGGNKPNYKFIMNRNKLRAKQRAELKRLKGGECW